MSFEFDRKTFVDAYFGYLSTKDDSLLWALEVFFSGWDRCDEKLELVLALVDGAADEQSLTYVASGPLEDLLRNCGDAVIDRIELSAANNPRLGRSLGWVWGLEHNPALEARVNRLLESQGLPHLVRRQPMKVAISLLPESVQGAISRLPEHEAGVHRVALVFAGGYVIEPVFVKRDTDALLHSGSLENAVDLGEDDAFHPGEVIDARLTDVGLERVDDRR
jgi:Family of unknown function (DUF6869)